VVNGEWSGVSGQGCGSLAAASPPGANDEGPSIAKELAHCARCPPTTTHHTVCAPASFGSELGSTQVHIRYIVRFAVANVKMVSEPFRTAAVQQRAQHRVESGTRNGVISLPHNELRMSPFLRRAPVRHKINHLNDLLMSPFSLSPRIWAWVRTRG
jgi:hypothetical protein